MGKRIITLAQGLILATLGWVTVLPTQGFAELILSAPPRESLETGKRIYEPLAQFLTQFLGEPVIYEHPDDWKTYEKKMKNDQYDIIFDGPHFAAWRIEALYARPLIKLPGALRFVLVVRESDKQYQEPKDLIGRTVCTLPPPNLGALTLFSMYPHPARQPDYYLIDGGFDEVARRFEQHKCDGAILRSVYYFKIAPPQFRESTRIIQRSKGLTNQGITISRRVKPELYKPLMESLTTGEGKLALRPILDRFSDGSEAFLPANDRDYEDLNLLHDKFIFGW